MRLNNSQARAVKFHETDGSEFYATTDGHVLRVAKATGRQREVKPKKGTLPQQVRIAGELKELRRIIAEATIGEIKRGIISHKDGNPRNCATGNLEIITGKGPCKPVEAIKPDEGVVYYPSIKNAAEALGVSETTLRRAKRKEAPSMREYIINF
ncbi:MAG: HNH endonuclease [Ruminococcus sp.]